MRHLLARLSLLAASFAAALTLAGSALADPSPPVLHPIPATVVPIGFGTYVVAWDPSTSWDQFALSWWWVRGYGLTVQSYPANQPTLAVTNTYEVGCCSLEFPITTGRHYRVSVRAYEYRVFCEPSGWSVGGFASTADAKEFDAVRPMIYLGG